MKQIALLLMAMVLPAVTLGQDLPDSPRPVDATQSTSSPDGSRVAGQSVWDRMERLPRGQKIKVRLGRGRWERCTVAGASETDLYCATESGSGFAHESQIKRASIGEFKLDHDVRNGRLIFAAATVGTGVALGIRSVGIKNGYTPEASGVFGGLIGAGLGALAGIPLSCLSGHCVSLPDRSPGPPAYGISANVPLRRMARRSHR